MRGQTEMAGGLASSTPSVVQRRSLHSSRLSPVAQPLHLLAPFFPIPTLRWRGGLVRGQAALDSGLAGVSVTSGVGGRHGPPASPFAGGTTSPLAPSLPLSCGTLRGRWGRGPGSGGRGHCRHIRCWIREQRVDCGGRPPSWINVVQHLAAGKSQDMAEAKAHSGFAKDIEFA